MEESTRTVKSELYNWLEDYAPADLLDKTAQSIKQLMLDIVGTDQDVHQEEKNGMYADIYYGRNKLRAELRTKINAL